MAEPWFIEQQDGSIQGPFHERRVAADLISGQIPAELRVRQGTGPWCLASRARELFRELAEQGWYIQTDDQTYGPFTPDRLLELQRAGELASCSQLRQGTTSEWKPAEKVLCLWQAQTCDPATSKPEDASATAPDSRTKWSTEPIRHYFLPLELVFQPVLETCYPNERLLISTPAPNSRDSRLAILRTNERAVGYLSLSNSQQLIVNRERGITHVALLSSLGENIEIAMILCPPGTSPDECKNYIEANFLATSPRSE